MAEHVEEAVTDNSMLKMEPPTRKLKDVVSLNENKIRGKAMDMNQALMTFAGEADAEYGEKLPFSESDNEDFESPNKPLATAEQRHKTVKMNNEMARKKIRREAAGGASSALDYLSNDSSYDSEVEKEKRKNAVNIFERDGSMTSLSHVSESQSQSNNNDLSAIVVQKRTVMFDLPTQ